MNLHCEVGRYDAQGNQVHPYTPGQCPDEVVTIIPLSPGGVGLFVCARHAAASEVKG